MKTLSTSPFTVLAMTVSLALASAVTSVHASGITSGVGGAVASGTTLASGDVFTGVLPHTQPMHIVIALKLRSGDQLTSLIAAHQTLTPAQFATQHSPTQLQAQAVATYLTRMGYTNVVIAPNRLLVSADGTAGTAQAAFQTSFARVQTHDGRLAFANDSDAHIPTSLQDSVLSVIGLQTAYQAHTFAQRAQPNAGSSTPSIAGHNPIQFSSIYGGTGVATAAGVTVGIISEGDMTQTVADLNTFTSNNALPTVATQTFYNGGNSGDTSGTVEWNLDSQDIVGMSGGHVGQIIFYAMRDMFNTSLVANMNAAMTANAAKIINVSIGECETGAQQDGSAAAADMIFQSAVAQGQTFSIASGDAGAIGLCGTNVPTPSWPASSPYVVAVGGTTLTASATTWSGETVWVDAGGAPSSFEPKPSWQNALVPGIKRSVPDIAFDADPNSGALIYIYGSPTLYGGTSLAAPLFVGEWARVLAVKGTAIGFAAPLLYQLPWTDFHDVTVGNNGGEMAKAGYDFASGRGSMILSSMINHVGVSSPLVANFSETASGLGAKFTDSSTDSASALTSHAWTFGDGGTSAAINPSHLYPKAGAYSVSETVGDAAGYVIAKTISVTIK